MGESYKRGEAHGNYKHGKPPEYRVWQLMKSRCYNHNGNNYARYGGRGIKVCDRWLGPDGFINFYNDMGPRPEGHYPSGYPMYTIDRIDNDGPYSPENCRWVNMTAQQNNKRSNRVYKGKTFAEWGKELGGHRHLVRRRLKWGWSIEDAISKPLGDYKIPPKEVKRNQRYITAFGKTQSINAWARSTGIQASTISKRLHKYGWTEEDAVSVPPHKKKEV